MTIADLFWFGVRDDGDNFILGLILIAGFSLQQFSKPTFDLTQIPIRFQGDLSDLTTRFRYITGSTIYLLGSALLYAMLCWTVGIFEEHFGSAVLEALGVAASFNTPIQVLLALAMVGLVPNIPFVCRLEEGFRSTCQELADVPFLSLQYAKEMSKFRREDISIPLEPDTFPPDVVDVAEQLDGNDPNRSTNLTFLLEKWLMSAFFIDRLGGLMQGTDRRFNSHFTLKFAREINEIQRQTTAMYIPRVEWPAVSAEQFEATMRNRGTSLEDLHNRICFIVGLVVFRGRNKGVSQQDACSHFGIDGNRVQLSRSILATSACGMSIVLVAALFFAVFAEFVVPMLVESEVVGPKGVSVYFVLSSLLVNGCTIWAVLTMRRYALGRGAWFTVMDGVPRRRSIQSYVLAGGLCAISALVAGYFYRNMLESAWGDLIGVVLEFLPYMAVHLAIGMTAVWNVDTNYLEKKLSFENRLVRVVFHGAAIAVVGWIASELYASQYSVDVEYVILSTSTVFFTAIAVSSITLLLVEPTRAD